MLWSQKLKICSKLSELNFFPHKCLLPDVILNEGVNKLTRRKHFLRQKFLSTVWEMSVCRKCKHYSQGFICFTFVLWRVTGYFRFSSNFACLYFMISSKDISASQRLKCSLDIFFLLGSLQTNSVVAAVEVHLL